MRKSTKRLSHSFMIILISITFFSILLISIFNIVYDIIVFQNEIKEIKETYIADQEYIISNQAAQIVNFIELQTTNQYHNEEIIKKEILDWISTIRFYNLGNEPGIMFVRNFDGIQLMSVSKPELIGTDTSEITDPEGINIHAQFMSIITNKGSGYAEYSWYNPQEGKISFKRSFVIAVPEWEWYIGAGFWFNDINSIINEKFLLLQRDVRIHSIVTLLFMLVMGIVAFLIIQVVARKVNQNMIEFINFFDKAAHQNMKINPEELYYSEFEEFANSANDMFEFRWKVQNELKQSQQNLAVTLNSIGDGVIVTDVKGRILRMNPIAEEITGWSLSDALQKKLTEIFNVINGESRQKVIDPIEKVMQVEKIVELANNTLLIRKNGEEISIADSAAPIKDQEGKIYGVVLVFRDVTQEKKMQDQLRQTQKLDSIGQLAGGIAHDFNNMLAGILGYAELLQIRFQDDKDALKYINEIIHTSERAAELTHKLLAFSYKSKAVSTPIDVHLVIDDALSILERSIDRRIRIRKNLNADISTIVGDPSQLQNDILNLGVNARDAMPHGGVLTVSTENIDLDKAYCEASPFELEPGPFIEISIRDSGIGMSKSVMEHIFEPFFTTKGMGKGTGLGLSAVYGSVKNHNGSITVYSEAGKGTVFHLYLPLNTSKSSIKDIHENYIPTGSGTILVIDDEEVIRNTARLMLEDVGYRVLTATDGQKGLDVFRKHQEEIDLVILDMIMPNMNGRDCFLNLKSIDPNVKVIISSGFSRDSSLTDLKQMGLIAFIHKPFRRSELARFVAEALLL